MVIVVSLTRNCSGFGEPCSDNSNCTTTGEGCGGSSTCECNPATHFQETVQSQIQCSAKATLGGSCPDVLNVPANLSCLDQNADCTADDSGHTCQCRAAFYDNNGGTIDGTCENKVDLGGLCTQAVSNTSTPCNTVNAVCTGSDNSYICQCEGNFYKSNTNICSQVGTTIGGPCIVPGGDTSGKPCRTSNSECTGASSGSTGKCSCSNDNYQSAANECSPKVAYGGSCTVYNSDASAPCSGTNVDCIGSSCKCKANNYLSGVNTCSEMVTYGGSCTVYNSDASAPCSGTNVDCIGSSCKCKANHYLSGVDTCSPSGEAVCGILTYLKPTLQWRNVTFVFKPDNYQSELTPILKNDDGKPLLDINAYRTELNNKVVYHIVFNTSADTTDYDKKYFFVSYGECHSNWTRLNLEALSDCGYLYIRTKVITAGGTVELGYFPTSSVLNTEDSYVRQWYNATSSSDMHLSDGYLSEREDPNWEFVLTIPNVNRWMSGNYSVRCTEGRTDIKKYPDGNKFTQPVEIAVIVSSGKPSLHSYYHTSECEDCLVGIDGKNLSNHIYCHTTGGTFPTIYVGGSNVTVHFISNDTYRPSYIASKDDHMKVVTCSVINAAMAAPLNTSSKLYVAVEPDKAVLNVPELKEGEPANITCTSKGGRPSSTLSLMLNSTNISSLASTITNNNNDSRTYTIQIFLEASAKREWHSLDVVCSQQTSLFRPYVTGKKVINCRYPPSEIFLEEPVVPFKLQNIYHLVYTCEVKDFNDDCSLQWTSDKPSLLRDSNPTKRTSDKSIMSILNVSVTKEDFGKVLVCSAVCSSFQRNISKSNTLVVPYLPVLSLSVGEELFLLKDESETVTCSAKSYPLADIVWSSEFSKPLRTCRNNATCTLSIEHISVDERRKYTCQASTKFGNTSSSFVAIGIGKHEKQGIKETESASPLPWIAAAVGCLILIIVIAGSVIVVRKRSQQKRTLNRQNEQLENIQNGNVETNETSPGNEDITYAQVVKPPTKRTPEKTRLAPTQATSNDTLIYADLDIEHLEESSKAVANKKQSTDSEPVEYVEINFAARAQISESENIYQN